MTNINCALINSSLFTILSGMNNILSNNIRGICTIYFNYCNLRIMNFELSIINNYRWVNFISEYLIKRILVGLITADISGAWNTMKGAVSLWTLPVALMYWVRLNHRKPAFP